MEERKWFVIVVIDFGMIYFGFGFVEVNVLGELGI